MKNHLSKLIEQLNIKKQGKCIAELFSEYFSTLAKELNDTDTNTNSTSLDMNGLLHTSKHSHSNNLLSVIPEITYVFVSNHLAHLLQNKSIGLENVNSKILKIAAPIISSHLANIINLHLN